MERIYLFDWGNTLMVDFPDQPGKMCGWEEIAIVPGAEELLRKLSQNSSIYIATGAADSTEHDIEQAFRRAGLHTYISGYFCYANTGIRKGTKDFLLHILRQLSAAPENVTVIGDSFENDILPAAGLGIQAFWLTKTANRTLPDNVFAVGTLDRICR